MADSKSAGSEVLHTDTNGYSKKSSLSLQEAFLNFRKRRMKELRNSLKAAEREKALVDESCIAILRQKFVDQAKQYLGVPYAKRYHEPGSPHYDSPLFLDCCGLVRRVVRDLKEDLGFDIGRWNQSYQFDTLPIKLDRVEAMKPGDLVFVSAIYYNEKKKKQHHNMVHVEIWLGEGEKTIGARWQRQHVQIHDSYQYVSKSYHSMRYHFRSIETWLKGICRSYCSEHSWASSTHFIPGSRSIFSLDCFEEDEDAEDSESEDKPGGSGGEKPIELTETDGDLCLRDKTVKKGATPTTSARQPRSPIRRMSRKRPSTKPSAPTFYIGGGNGVSLVEGALLGMGWKRTDDRFSTDFTLKWVELKRQINYREFKEGQQLVNHISNINMLTTKIGLLDSLRDYCQLKGRRARPSLTLSEFVPETYKLDLKSEREVFYGTFKDGDVWICKPTGSNQGKGIFLVKNLDKFRLDVEAGVEATLNGRRSRLSSRIVQRYIQSPLLLCGRKFDIRAYLLIAHTTPYVVFYHHGYVRLSLQQYSVTSSELAAHLTNQYVQKRDPLYSDMKEDTVWTFEQLQKYLNANLATAKNLPSDWVFTQFTKQMQHIMLSCFHSVKHKLECRLGFFELLGFDFMIDSEMKVWLIEVNINPALHTNCNGLKQVIPPLVTETLHVVVELFEKSRHRQPLFPISSYSNLQLLHQETGLKCTPSVMSTLHHHVVPETAGGDARCHSDETVQIESQLVA